MTTQTSPGAAQPGSADTADQAAPLDALLADAVLGTFRQFPWTRPPPGAYVVGN
jgi:hypothetical protein